MDNMDNYKSCKGSTMDTSAHMKLSDSTEFKLKTWNSNPKEKRWISTGMGGARKALDSGIHDNMDSQVSIKKENIDLAVGGYSNLAAQYAPRVKELNKLAAKERRGDTKRVFIT